MLQREIIVFDFETNGFNGTSVLSLSAIKALIKDGEIKEIDRFDRYYYRTPGEALNPVAISINGLDEKVISKCRDGVNYPEHYVDDVASFVEFCGDIDHFVAHNFSFDRDFMGFEALISFCTFLEAKKMNICKYNKLSDLARYYGVEIDDSKLHNSMYDVEVLFDIVKGMFCEKNENFIKFLCERPLNKKEQKYIQIRFNSYLKSKRELKERTEKNRDLFSDRSSEIVKAIEIINLPNQDITVTQFLYHGNKILSQYGVEEVKATLLNNFLKKFGILSSEGKLTVTNNQSKDYGIYSEKRSSLQGDYEVILYDSIGKKHLKKYFTKLILEQL